VSIQSLSGRRPLGITILAAWLLIGSTALLAFAVFTTVTSRYPFGNSLAAIALTIVNLPIGGVFGFLYGWLAFALAAIGFLAAFGTYYGRNWSRFLNIALSCFVVYQGAMLFVGHFSLNVAFDYDRAANLAVISFMLLFSGARIYYMFTPPVRAFFRS
jgi:hypothetical protein